MTTELKTWGYWVKDKTTPIKDVIEHMIEHVPTEMWNCENVTISVVRCRLKGGPEEGAVLYKVSQRK